MPDIQVKGMSCSHCVAAMTKAMNSLAGVSNVKVDLGSGKVSYDTPAPIPKEELERVVKSAGFELVPSRRRCCRRRLSRYRARLRSPCRRRR